MPAAELAHIAGVGTSVIKTMAAIGLLEGVERRCGAPSPQPDGERPGPTLSPEQAVAAQGAGRQGAGARLLRDPARRRDRLRQDRGLFRGGRRGARRRPAGAGAAARDRADGAVAGTLRGPLRRAAGGVAFRPHQPERRETWRAVAEGRRRRRGRRALGAVPAVPRSRPDRRRRGARQLLQAGGRRRLPRPRHGGGARPAGRARRSCWSRRRRRSRASSTSTRGRYGALHLPARHGGSSCRRIEAVDLRRDAAGARPLAVAAAGRGADGDAGRRRAGAAVPQSPRLCAADPVPRLRPPHRMPATAPPGWSSTASAGGCSAIIAATPSRRRMPASTAAPPISFVACGPGVERLAEEATALFPEARARALHLGQPDRTATRPTRRRRAHGSRARSTS